MSEAGFTKGPWVLNNDAPLLVRAKSKSICLMKNTHSEENGPNASLIAAAPAMFDALNYVRAYLSARSDWAGTEALASDIDAAIAKALGR